MDRNNPMIDNIEKKTGVNMNEIMKLVNSLKTADLSDEKTARKLVHQVSRIANKPVSKEKEDKLVKAIMNKNVPNDLSFIAQMFGGKK